MIITPRVTVELTKTSRKFSDCKDSVKPFSRWKPWDRFEKRKQISAGLLAANQAIQQAIRAFQVRPWCVSGKGRLAEQAFQLEGEITIELLVRKTDAQLQEIGPEVQIINAELREHDVRSSSLTFQSLNSA